MATGFNNTGFVNTGMNFSGFNNTGVNNPIQSGFTQDTGFSFNAPKNPLTNRYPDLTDEEIEELRKAANAAGYTGNLEEYGMDILYQKGINEFENNKKLDQRRELTNQQCNEIAKYKGADKQLQEQTNRLSILGSTIKEVYADKVSADADDCDIITKYIGGKGLQTQFYNYLNGDDTLLEIVKGRKANKSTYTPGNKGFWQTKAGAVLGLAGMVSVPAGMIYGAIKGGKAIVNNITKGEGLQKLGKNWYSSVVTDTELDRRRAMTRGAEEDLLGEYKTQLDEMNNQLKAAQEAGDTATVEKMQKAIDEHKGLIKDLESRTSKEIQDTADTAMKYKIEGGSYANMAKKATKEKLDLWNKKIGKVYKNADKLGYTINRKEIVDRVCDNIINNVQDYAGYDSEMEAPLKEAAQKIKDSYANSSIKNDLTATEGNSWKSSMASRNESFYTAKAQGKQLQGVSEADTIVREQIIKEARKELYEIGEKTLKEMGAEGEEFQQLLKERGDLDVIAENMLKKGSLSADKKGIGKWFENQVKTRVGRKLAQGGKAEAAKGAEAVTEATKGAEAVTEATKGAEVVSEATKGAEIAGEATKGAEVVSDVAKGAEVASEVSKGAEVAGKTEAVTSKVSKAVETALQMEKGAETGGEVVKVSRLAKLGTKVGKVLGPVLKFLGEIATPLTYYEYSKELSKTKEDAQVQALSYLYRSVSKRGFDGGDIDAYSKEFANLVNKQSKMFGTGEDLKPEEVRQVIEEAIRENEGIEALPDWVLNQQ